MYQEYDNDEYPEGKTVTLYAGYYPYPRPRHFQDWVKIYGLWQCKKYIATFRDSITRLGINYKYMNKTHAELLNRLVAATCGEHLVELRLSHWNSDVRLDSFTSVFDNVFDRVTTLAIKNSDLTNQFEYLAQFFPKVTRYEHYNVEADSFEVYFEQLEILDIEFHGYNIDPIEPLLQFNNEVRHLEISGPSVISIYSLIDMIGNNSTIDTLMLTSSRPYHIEDAEIEYLTREHPRLETLGLRMVYFTIDQAVRLMENLIWLKDFTYRQPPGNDVNDLLPHLDGTDWRIVPSFIGFWVVRLIHPQN